MIRLNDCGVFSHFPWREMENKLLFFFSICSWEKLFGAIKVNVSNCFFLSFKPSFFSPFLWTLPPRLIFKSRPLNF